MYSLNSRLNSVSVNHIHYLVGKHLRSKWESEAVDVQPPKPERLGKKRPLKVHDDDDDDRLSVVPEGIYARLRHQSPQSR
jgi:hypothetical protein